MNALFFRAKRAFHATLHLTRRSLARMGLTAARFDMLKSLSGGFRVEQRHMRASLGVTAPTISRMLGSLEALGLVTRTRSERDRRQRVVRLTDAGERLVRRASRRFIESGAIQLAVDCALCGPLAHDDTECFLRMMSAEAVFDRFEEAFHRPASFHYPWHPDD
jgi:DNA-binding MarR family transcriptional regulator